MPPLELTYGDWTTDTAQSTNIDIASGGDTFELATTIPDSGVSRWEFEQDVTDSWGSNDGTDNTSAGYATGHIGNYAKDFDGTDDYVEVPDDASLQLETFTVAAWINPDGALTGTNTTLGPCRWEGGVGGNNNYLVFINGSDELEGRFNSGDGPISVVYSTLPSADTWTHLAFAFDGSQMRLYVDGNRVADTNTTAIPVTGSFPVQMGVRSEGGNGAVGWFDGQLDDPRIYNKGLGDTEVSNLYNSGSIDG